MTKRAVAYVSDLMFASNIEATLGRAGYEVKTVEDIESLGAAVNDETAAVVLDLHAGAEARDVVAVAGKVPVLAFGRHTDAPALREAREAGCAGVVARSTLVANMVELIERLGDRASGA